MCWRIIAYKFNEYFASRDTTTNGVLTDQQFSFRKKHTITHTLHKSVNDIIKSISNNNHVVGKFIDMSKAFDTLDHKLFSSVNHHREDHNVSHSRTLGFFTPRCSIWLFQGHTMIQHLSEWILSCLTSVPSFSVTSKNFGVKYCC